MTTDRFHYRRVSVVGTTASGKSTLARALAARIGVPYVELDALYWQANWTEASTELFRERVLDAAAGDDWVIDGNYSAVRDLVWGRAEAVVWLDPPLRVILWQYLVRTRRRLGSRQEIWPGTGNRERWSHLLRRDGLLWWILTTFRGRRRRYAALLEGRPKVRVIRLRSMAAVDRWLRGLTVP